MRNDPPPAARPRPDEPYPRFPMPRAAPRSRRSLGPALAMATPHAITAGLAAIPTAIALPTAGAALPLWALLIVAVQVGGVLLARGLEVPGWGRVWLLALTTTAVLLPLLALLAATAREPFVAWERGTAGPVIWSSAGVVASLLGLALLAAIVTADAPEQAVLLFLPAPLLVPAVLGAPGELDERWALGALMRAFGVATVAVLFGSLLPPGARPLVGPLALAAQFGGLWLLGYRPAFPADRGDIVPILASLIVVVAATATVLVPLAALWARRVLRAAQKPE